MLREEGLQGVLRPEVKPAGLCECVLVCTRSDNQPSEGECQGWATLGAFQCDGKCGIQRIASSWTWLGMYEGLSRLCNAGKSQGRPATRGNKVQPSHWVDSRGRQLGVRE